MLVNLTTLNSLVLGGALAITLVTIPVSNSEATTVASGKLLEQFSGSGVATSYSASGLLTQKQSLEGSDTTVITSSEGKLYVRADLVGTSNSSASSEGKLSSTATLSSSVKPYCAPSYGLNTVTLNGSSTNSCSLGLTGTKAYGTSSAVFTVTANLVGIATVESTANNYNMIQVTASLVGSSSNAEASTGVGVFIQRDLSVEECRVMKVTRYDNQMWVKKYVRDMELKCS
jgi:hypothetical protein